MKRKSFVGILMLALALVLSVPASAQLAPYSQDFEGLDQANPDALGADGWLVFGNVFDGDGNYQYGYGVFPAPNPGGGFSAIDSGQGGPDQGAQQLAVYSDYNNGDHGKGWLIEANVFQERVIAPEDVGSTWVFAFDAKRGSINDPSFPSCPCSSVALAFFKTLDPANGFALTNFIAFDTTNLPDAWGSYELSIDIDPSLSGQLLQFGFLSTATLFQPSAVFYDNVNFFKGPLQIAIDIKPDGFPNSIQPFSMGVIPVAILGSDSFDVTEVDVATLGFGPNGAAPFHDLTDPITYSNHLGDANDDGFTDLVTHFRTHETGITWSDTEATLVGTTLDGEAFEGTDSVRTVGLVRFRGFDQEARRHLTEGERRRTTPQR